MLWTVLVSFPLPLPHTKSIIKHKHYTHALFPVHHFISSMISLAFPPAPSSSACPPYSHGWESMAALLIIVGCLGFIAALALLALWLRAVRKNIVIYPRRRGSRRVDPEKGQEEEEEEEEGRGGEGPELCSPKSSVLPTRLPLIKYEAMEGGESGCSICGVSFKEGEPCRVMRECGHKFHYLCVDPLVIKPTACPICRTPHLPFVYQTCA